MFLASVLLVSPVVLAGNFIAFQGNVKEGGVSLSSGNLSVVIFDAMSGGSVIYNSTNDFDGAISDGEYDVMLGNGSNELNLNYGTKYYLEMFVNGEAFSFDGNSRQVFESAVGNITYVSLESNIPASYINKTAGTNWVGTNVESILDTIYSWISGVNTSASVKGLGFNTTAELDTKYIAQSEESNLNVNHSSTSTLADSASFWAGVSGWVTGWFVQSGNNLAFNETKLNATIDDRAGVASGDIDAVNTSGDYLTGGADSGDVDLYLNETKLNETIDDRSGGSSGNASWNQTLADSLYAGLLGGNAINGTQEFNGGWSVGGLSIVGGNIFAQTVYVYNLSSLSVSELHINGSMIPAEGFSETFDIGSLALKWKDLYMSGNLSLGGGVIMWNSSANNYIYYNGSNWQTFGTGNGTGSGIDGIWTNVSGVAIYEGSINVTNVTLASNCADGEILKWSNGVGVCGADVGSISAVGWNKTGTNVFLDDNSSSVGIGTETPSQKLEIVGNVNVTGNLTLGSGQIWFNESDKKYYYYNETAWNVVGSGSSSGADGIWANNSGVATYDGSANVTENLDVGGNVSLGQIMTFALGETIDNIVDGWIRVAGSLRVVGDLQVDGIFKLKESDAIPEADVGYGKIYAVNGTGGLDDYTVLLLHGDGAGQDFVDSSNSSHTINVVGSTTQTVSERKFNVGKSIYFDNFSYLNISDDDDFNFGTNDFTMDVWVFIPTGVVQTSNDGFLGQNDLTNSDQNILQFAGSNIVRYQAQANSLNLYGSSLSTNEWHHVAIVRSGDDALLFVDGLNVDSGSFTGGVNIDSPFWIGNRNYGAGDRIFEGYLDEIRITKGLARWTENFTVADNPYDAAGLYFKDDAGRVTSLLAGGVAAASATWGQNGTNVTYQQGNVGIGTGLPEEKLHVVGNTKIEGDVIIELLSLGMIRRFMG